MWASIPSSASLASLSSLSCIVLKTLRNFACSALLRELKSKVELFSRFVDVDALALEGCFLFVAPVGSSAESSPSLPSTSTSESEPSRAFLLFLPEPVFLVEVCVPVTTSTSLSESETLAAFLPFPRGLVFLVELVCAPAVTSPSGSSSSELLFPPHLVACFLGAVLPDWLACTEFRVVAGMRRVEKG